MAESTFPFHLCPDNDLIANWKKELTLKLTSIKSIYYTVMWVEYRQYTAEEYKEHLTRLSSSFLDGVKNNKFFSQKIVAM